MALATDLGYMPPNVKAALKRIDVLLLESNHDLEMLRDGPYPWSVKQRVLSRVGHLSNHATAEFLQKDYDGGAAWIVLGHLSESNNAPELARLSAEQALGNQPTLLGTASCWPIRQPRWTRSPCNSTFTVPCRYWQIFSFEYAIFSRSQRNRYYSVNPLLYSCYQTE